MQKDSSPSYAEIIKAAFVFKLNKIFLKIVWKILSKRQKKNAIQELQTN